VAVVLGHDVVSLRPALAVELPVVDAAGRAGREQRVPLLLAEPRADDQHRHRDVEGGGVLGEDRRRELRRLAGAGDGVDADECRELEARLGVAQGQGERRVAASAVAGQCNLGKICVDAFREYGGQPLREPLCDLGCRVDVARVTIIGYEAALELHTYN
jgi:hypothetical protein